MLMFDEKKIMSFREWMMQFIDQPTPYGDLVRDMKSDHDLPESNKRYDIERYLDLERSACENALMTFQNAYDDYEIYVESVNLRNKLKNN